MRVLAPKCSLQRVERLLHPASSLLGDAAVRVWLSRKLAEFINGIDLRGRHVGDVLDLPRREAELLLGDGYAEVERRVGGDRRALTRCDASEDRRGAAAHRT